MSRLFCGASRVTRCRWGSLLLLGAVAAACSAPSDGNLAVRVLSSPPEWVSGGDARLAVSPPAGVDPEDVRIEVNGEPVSARLTPRIDGDGLEAVLTGLDEGENTVRVYGGDASTELRLVNHSAGGPLFSGPRQVPFLCATPAHRAEADLGPSLDADCTVETRVDYLYLSTESDAFVPYDPAAPRPSDLAQTTTLEGETVDFIVRWERGTLNRFIYSLAVLSPNPDTDTSTTTLDLSGWNRRLIYYFQGGVGIGHYQGAPSRTRMLYRHGLALGYAVAYSTGTRTGTHYDLEVGGETALMVKDRFVSAYGAPLYTVGVGGSGGGIQQYVYGQNHPGLIDAGIPQYSYPDMVTQTIHIGDCELLERYMDAEVAADPSSKWATWTNRTWLEGLNASDSVSNPYNGDRLGTTECIQAWRGLTPLSMNPHYGTAPGLAEDERAAVEWTHYADVDQIYGRGEDGYARRTWDNVGVQYGLDALVRGRITPGEFLDLNARIGGWKNEPDMVQEGRPFVDTADDVDPWSARNMTLSPQDRGDPPAPRTEADAGAIEAAYTRGLVFTGAIDIPLIDWRHYLEAELDMHNSHQSFAARQRMLDHDGDAAHQVVWFTGAVPDHDRFDQTPMAFEVIDAWMANLRAYPERGVAGNKPERAVDSCFDANGALIYAGADAWDGILNNRPEGPCARRFPVYRTSRIVAGGPISGDVFKCRLQPVEAAFEQDLYGDWTPTEAERARLQAIFPEGVCDYRRGDARRPPDL